MKSFQASEREDVKTKIERCFSGNNCVLRKEKYQSGREIETEISVQLKAHNCQEMSNVGYYNYLNTLETAFYC